MLEISQFTGLQIVILGHGQFYILPEGAPHAVMTVGTAGSHISFTSDF